MKLLSDRFKSNSETTLGKLFIDEIFECYILEDESRTKKIYGETRIPAGIYEVKLRTEGGMHERYLKRFPEWHVGMLHLQNVPGFKYIYMHPGNTEKDTLGCLLTGEKIAAWKLLNSVFAYENMYKQVAAALLQHEEVTIKIEDNDIKV